MAVTDGDQLLVERARKGDRRAFDLLVLKYQQKILKLSMRYVRDQTEALDVSQEAFVKAYRALPAFRGESVSLFFEPGVAAAERGEGSSRMGDANAYTTDLGVYMLTAVGEVPLSTVKAIARAIRPTGP